MLADIGQRLRKEGICHGGHGDEEMMGQIDALHEANEYAITISWDCIPEWTGGCLSVSCSPVKGPSDPEPVG
jgi:hypothetical protein